MPSDVPLAFFSYCRADAEFALRLAEDLKAGGANVWMDQLDIEPGEPWDRSVEEAVTKSPRMIVLLSPVSVASDNVRDEISFALSRQKRVIPALYRDCDVPFRLARLQYIDFRVDYKRGLKALIRVLVMEHPAQASPTPTPAPPIATATPVSGPDERAAEQTHAKQLEPERPAAEEKAEQGELERQRVAAEQARLEEERKEAAAEKARPLQVEPEPQAAVEKARPEEAAAEKAQKETEERERAAAKQARAKHESRERSEAEERARQAAVPTFSSVDDRSSPLSADVRLVSNSQKNTWIKPVGIGLAVLLVLGLIVQVIWQRSNETPERGVYTSSLAEERARAERTDQQASNQPSSTTTQSSQPSAPPVQAKAPEKPQQLTAIPAAPPPTSRPRSDATAAAVSPVGMSAGVNDSYLKALSGDSHAMTDVGVAYYYGNGAPKDFSQALVWFRKAADLGNGVAMANLGNLYEQGEGVEKNLQQALRWYRKAADTGDPVGLNSLAWAYATSSDPAIRNPTAALEYALKAVKAGGAKPDPNHIDTLAEAYYVNKQYLDAVKTEERAIASAPQEQKGEFQKHLEKYQRAGCGRPNNIPTSKWNLMSSAEQQAACARQ